MPLNPPQNDGLPLTPTPWSSQRNNLHSMQIVLLCLLSPGIHFITIILGGFVCVGGLQNGYRKTQCSRAHNTTHNPQPTTHNPQPTTHNPQPTTHNSQHQDEPPPPYPPAASPSLSMGRAVAPPNLGAAIPHGSTASAWWRVCDRRGWFSCLGHRNVTR